jgi:AraC-like DNA-binding protein
VITVFRAEGKPERTRTDYWRQVIASSIGPLEPHGGLPDQIVAGEVGAVRIAELTSRTPGGASRGRRQVRAADPHFCKIDVLVRGRGVVVQDGREAELAPGDFTFVDLSRPAYWDMSPVRLLGVVFPPAMLPLPRDELARLTAVRIPGGAGAGALGSGLARQLVGRLHEHTPADGPRLGSALLDLFTVALAGRLDRRERVPADTRQRALLWRVHAYIERRLADRDLSPEVIAAAHHVSVRYLYKLFEAEGESVADWVRQRRLDRCRRDLRDPALRSRPVSAIAARWGFPSAAHFSRAFRAAHGVPPAEYRRLASL